MSERKEESEEEEEREEERRRRGGEGRERGKKVGEEREGVQGVVGVEANDESVKCVCDDVCGVCGIEEALWK